MSVRIFRFVAVLSLLALSLASTLFAEVTIFAPTGLAVVETVYIDAEDPCGGADDPADWSIDPGPDGSAVLYSFAQGEGITWTVSWTSAGTKPVTVTIDSNGGGAPGSCMDSGSVPVEVNSCAFSANTYEGPEGYSIEVTAERVNGADGYLDCEIYPTGGSATPDLDYGDPSTTFFWEDGDGGPQSIFIETNPDTEAEGDETIELILSPYVFEKPLAVNTGGSGVRVGSAGSFVTDSATAIIQDAGACEFTQEIYEVEESVGNAQITLTRGGGTSGGLECYFYAYGGEGSNSATAEEDFLPVQESVFWDDGEGGERFVQVPIIDDEDAEPIETVLLEAIGYVSQGGGQPNFAGTGVRSGDSARVPAKGLPPAAFASLDIVDNDGVEPTVISFVTDASETTEGQPPHTIQVTRSSTNGEASVQVVVAPGGSASPEDYSFEGPITLSWENGEDGIREFQVTALPDSLNEDDETVVFELTNPQGPGFNPPILVEPTSHTLTIVDVAEGGAVRFTSETFQGVEGGGSVEIGVVRELGSGGDISVDVCFLGGTSEPEDVVLPASATLEWADGETGVKTLALGVVDDAEIEGTETLPIELCEATEGLTLAAPSEATVSILDNDFESEEEIVIETESVGPENPIVVYDREGRKIVVWVALDGEGFGVFAQIFDTDGEPLGPPFRVNESAAGNSTQPSAIIRDDGTIVIVWRQSGGDGLGFSEGRLASFGGSSSVVARGFSPTGSSTGSETVVSSSETGDNQNPEVGTDRDGELTITWQQGDSIKGQSFDASFTPRTPIVDVSSIPGASDPEVAVSASGDFVVVWKQAPGTADGTILIQAFNDDGTTKGEVRVASRNSQADEPAIAIDDQGNFFVVFTEPADGIDVFGRLYDRRGRRERPKFRVNAITAGDQTNPRVDMNSIGDIAVVWESDTSVGTPGAVGTGGGNSIVSRFFTPQGEAESGDVAVSESEAGSTAQNPDISIEDEDETTVVFERRSPEGESEGIFSRVITPTLTSGPCSNDDVTLCIQGEQRFRVLVEWQDFDGNSGEGQAVPLTGDTGYFWFFGPDNVELLIKVLDGCAINDRLWVFAGGLTNVEVNLRVDDVVAGITATYFSSLGRSFQPIIDIDAFDTCDAEAPPPADLPEALTALLEDWPSTVGPLRDGAGGGVACESPDPALCLRDERFEVTLLWESEVAAGAGQPVPLTDETGTFWFFDPENVEAVIKVLDGCSINGHYWVFATGITDVATDLQVLDTATSTSRSYVTELGTPFVPVLDVEAFECQ